MNSESAERALRPVESEPGVLVHPTADRRLAVEHWLLSTTPYPDRARRQWRDQGTAMLPLGGLIAAVRIPGRLLTALTGPKTELETDEFLAQALDDGPVICDLRVPRYYVLVPGRMPATWSQAADEWRWETDVEVLGRDDYLAVPRLSAVDPEHAAGQAYWSVPMSSAGELCSPLAVARLIAAARHALGKALEQ
jgi:hypothetical protein